MARILHARPLVCPGHRAERGRGESMRLIARPAPGDLTPEGTLPSAEPVATVDAAPTLARLGGIPAPVDLDGRVLESVLAR